MALTKVTSMRRAGRKNRGTSPVSRPWLTATTAPSVSRRSRNRAASRATSARWAAGSGRAGATMTSTRWKPLAQLALEVQVEPGRRGDADVDDAASPGHGRGGAGPWAATGRTRAPPPPASTRPRSSGERCGRGARTRRGRGCRATASSLRSSEQLLSHGQMHQDTVCTSPTPGAGPGPWMLAQAPARPARACSRSIGGWSPGHRAPRQPRSADPAAIVPTLWTLILTTSLIGFYPPGCPADGKPASSETNPTRSRLRRAAGGPAGG